MSPYEHYISLRREEKETFDRSIKYSNDLIDEVKVSISHLDSKRDY